MTVATVLVVDDNQDVLKFMRRLLQGSGFNAFTAADTKTAREIVDREKPRVVIADLYLLPGDDSNVFVRAILALGVIVFRVTGHPLDVPADARGNGIFVKPINVDEMISALRACVV